MSNYASKVMQGSVMVEFAGVIILLTFFVFGVSEIGRAIYQLNTLTKAVESGARYMSRYVGAVDVNHETQECNITNGDVVAKWNAAKIGAENITKYGTDKVDAASPPPLLLPNLNVDSITVDWKSDGGSADNGACVITVDANAAFVSLFGEYIVPPLFGKNPTYQNILLQAKSEERYIGE